MAEEGPDYDTCCKLVGRLFLESQAALERLSEKCQAETAALRQQLQQVAQERDQVLGLLKAAKQERVVAG